MATDDGSNRQDDVFTARLTPYRSLPPRRFVQLMLALGVYNFCAGTLFLWLGAWPVFGFLGLEFAAIYGAFRWNYWRARAYEDVRISRDLLLIRAVSAHGKVNEYRLNPLWSRINIERGEDGTVRRIAITSRGTSLELGSFLTIPDRTRFAVRFAGAMRRIRLRI